MDTVRCSNFTKKEHLTQNIRLASSSLGVIRYTKQGNKEKKFGPREKRTNTESRIKRNAV